MPGLTPDLPDDWLKHLHLPPPVPQGFNLLNAKPAELAMFGYPQRPPEENEEARRIWRMLVTGTPLRRREDPELRGLSFGDYTLNYASQSFSGRQESSLNWSGAVARGGDIKSVFGSFQVPPFSAPAAIGSYRCSTWIGVDGHDPTSQSMPQIGVTMRADVSAMGAVLACESWFQWWSRTIRIPPITIDTLPFASGDLVACALDILSPDRVNLTIQNNTQVGSPTFAITLTTRYYLFTIEPVTATTAEWIAERPTEINSDERYPLPVFEVVKFNAATVAGQPGHARDPGPMRIIRMVEPITSSPPTPGRLAVLSRAMRATNLNGSTSIVAGPRLAQFLTG
jgi:hypothetical protein